jgi:hypothetical protein
VNTLRPAQNCHAGEISSHLLDSRLIILSPETSTIPFDAMTSAPGALPEELESATLTGIMASLRPDEHDVSVPFPLVGSLFNVDGVMVWNDWHN